jgi:hypothetical protein
VKRNETNEAALVSAVPPFLKKNETNEAALVSAAASFVSFIAGNDDPARFREPAPAEIDCRSLFAGDDETDNMPLAADGDGWVRSLLQ